MQNFRNVDALCGVMASAFRVGPGAAGRDLFAQVLVKELEFTKEQAELYASVVLARNSEGSADRARRIALSLIGGKWTHMQSDATNPLVYAKSTQDTWEFKDDLTYEHRLSSYEGYVAPPSNFGSFSYSRPSERMTRGIWAPPDWWEDSLKVVTIPEDGDGAYLLAIEWTDPTQLYHTSCRINGSDYARISG